MSDYFRITGAPTPSASNDLGMLPKALRSDADLSTAIVEAEARVIRFYEGTPHRAAYRDRFTDGAYDRGFVTSELSQATLVDEETGRYVFLRGYTVDADLCEDDALKKAIRLEVARVARWIFAQWRKEPLLESESKEDGSDTYRHDAEDNLPPDFGFHLRAWDVRPRYDGL